MIPLLAQNWWSLVIRGVVGIVLGLVAILWPGITFTALVFLFGAYALINGIVSLAGAWRASRLNERWGVLLLEGLVGIAAAVITVFWPAITALALIAVIAAWAMVTGALEIAAAVRLRKYISGEWLLALSGVASIVFGVLVALAPAAGAVVIALLFGVYTMVFGALLVALGLRLRTWAKAQEAGPAAQPRAA